MFPTYSPDKLNQDVHLYFVCFLILHQTYIVFSAGPLSPSVARLIQEPEVRVRYPVRPHTSVPPSADSRRAIVMQLLTKVCA